MRNVGRYDCVRSHRKDVSLSRVRQFHERESISKAGRTLNSAKRAEKNADFLQNDENHANLNKTGQSRA
jgi:hypothetical protein